MCCAQGRLLPAAPVRSPVCDGRSHQTLARSTSHAAPARVGGSRRRLRLVMDRAGSAGQRGSDNAALDVVVDAANALLKPVVVFLARVPYDPNASLRHYHLLAEG